MTGNLTWDKLDKIRRGQAQAFALLPIGIKDLLKEGF